MMRSFFVPFAGVIVIVCKRRRRCDPSRVPASDVSEPGTVVGVRIVLALNGMPVRRSGFAKLTGALLASAASGDGDFEAMFAARHARGAVAPTVTAP